MFDSFTNKISDIFEKLKKSGILKEEDIDNALREIRIALLEADVSINVAKKFIADVKEKSIGQNIIKSISPAQMITKIVHDHLVELLGSSEEIKFNEKTYKIMLVGLQGAGKTTTAAKLVNFFTNKKKKVVVGSTDIQRPAAIEQLRILSSKIDGSIFAQDAENTNLSHIEISELLIKRFNQENANVLILDTAGRLHIDDVKMNELLETQKIINPDEIWLVVDIMTGQDAVNIAKYFSDTMKISGVILTRVDGDARGGVALSMRALTGCDIKFLCVGEHLNDIEFFDADRIANRILGMGDIVSLVEKAQETFSKKEAEETAERMQKGEFTFDDLAVQMEKMSKLGGLKFILNMIPQGKQVQTLMDSQGISDKTVSRNIAIIKSMTKKEKKNYKVINGSRRKRIANGSGTTVQEVNKLIKQYEGVSGMLKKLKKSGGIGQMLAMMKR